MLITSGGDTVKVWDPFSGNQRFILHGVTGAALAVAVNNTSDLIAAGLTDKSATIWNANSRKIKHTMTGHGGKVNSLTFFGNKSMLTTGCTD